VAKLRDVSLFTSAPPERAAALRVDENSQI
jgi:hypothetical protein